MNHCNSVRVVAPLISGELFRYTLAVPSEYKQRPEGNDKVEKWIFRKAFEEFLPAPIIQRVKQEFSQGSGSAALLPGYFENVIGDDEFSQGQSKYPLIRSKEELYYFQIFTDNFGDGKAVETVGQWVSHTGRARSPSDRQPALHSSLRSVGRAGRGDDLPRSARTCA